MTAVCSISAFIDVFIQRKNDILIKKGTKKKWMTWTQCQMLDVFILTRNPADGL